jgi:peptide-methionine (R)-S-oxide reductase
MNFPMSRRRVLFGAAIVGVLAGCSAIRNPLASGTPATPDETFEVTHTDDEWHRLLNAEQYDVLRNAGTERPYSSPLNDEHHDGVFACAGCAQELFSSKTKFDSGTGWPSFWKPLDKAVMEHSDRTLGMERTEVRCARCGGHLGHVFDDGPRPTGLRYCMNGVAMTFKTAQA